MNETMKTLFGLFGGLAIFLFGMNQMSDALQKAAGERMKKILAMFTSNPVKGVLAGALVTAVLQSSSATTVMAIGFVSAGLMTLPQAISVIFGANIGTTMTAQLIAFDINDYIYPIIFVGFLTNFIGKKEKTKSIGTVILSFGLLFLGISTMSSVMKPLANSPVFIHMLEKVADIPVLGVLVGLCMTLVVQSSSATIAVLQNFAAQAGPNGHSLLGLAGAIPVLLGDNIGTTITALLASLGGSRNAKRTAIAHSIFNISGTLLFIWFVKPYAHLITMISPHGAETAVISRQIANAHTGFNLTMTILWTPLLWLMVKIVMRILPETAAEKKARLGTSRVIMYLDDSVINQPAAALQLVVEEAMNLGNRIGEVLRELPAVIRGDQKSEKVMASIEESKELHKAILDYMTKLYANGVLNEDQAHKANGIMYIVDEIDRIRHVCHNVIDISTQDQTGGFSYSAKAISDVNKSLMSTLNMYFATLEVIATGDVSRIHEIKNIKNTLVQFNVNIQNRHLKRVAKGECAKELTASFTELISNIDRITSNCDNILEAVNGHLNLNELRAIEDHVMPSELSLNM